MKSGECFKDRRGTLGIRKEMKTMFYWAKMQAFYRAREAGEPTTPLLCVREVEEDKPSSRGGTCHLIGFKTRPKIERRGRPFVRKDEAGRYGKGQSEMGQFFPPLSKINRGGDLPGEAVWGLTGSTAGTTQSGESSRIYNRRSKRKLRKKNDSYSLSHDEKKVEQRGSTRSR